MLSCMFGWQQFFAVHRRSSGAAIKLRFMIRWIPIVVLCAPAVATAQAADLEQGKQLFESLCGSCHGPLGNGGRGANLAQPRLRHATDDQALQNVIRRGIPGTEMPRHTFLNPGKLASVAAYVKTLGRVAPEQIPGNASRGETVYTSLDCAMCHTVGGQGGIVGPVLDEIGARRSAAHIKAALIEPEAFTPEGYLQLRAVTKEGVALTGMRINEDGFSVQFRDFSEGLHSFWKDELDVLEKQWQRSPMASYEGRLTSEQMDDLVAYLVSLKGST